MSGDTEGEGAAIEAGAPLYSEEIHESYEMPGFSHKENGEKTNAFLIKNSRYLKREERDPRLFRSPHHDDFLFVKTELDLIDRFGRAYVLTETFDALADQPTKVRELTTLRIWKFDEMQQKTRDLITICAASGKSIEEAQFAVDPAIRELFDRCGQLRAEIQAIDEQIKHIQDKEPEKEWDQPLPLNSSLPSVKPLTKDLIPESLRGWLVDIAERMQIPLEFTAVPCLVLLGSLIGRKIGMYPKAHDNWLVVANLWGKLVGRPSLLKSPAINEIRAPIEKLIVSAMKAYEDELAEFEQERSWAKAKKSAYEDDLKKAARDKKASRPVYEPIVEPKEPSEKRFVTNDPTVEKIGEILLENPQGILLLRDELLGWLRLLDKPGREGDRQFYLEAWNGTGSFTIDRIGRGTLYIPALCISLMGAITPGPLSKYVLDAISGGYGDDGLLQRFQLSVWPDVPPVWVNIDRIPDEKAKDKAFKIFENIANFEGEKDRIVGINFSSDAQLIFNQWREKLEHRLRSGELTSCMESHLGKYRSLVPKLALIFHIAETIGSGIPLSEVSSSEALLAIRWCEHLEQHAFRIYHPADPGMESAKSLLEKIRTGHLDDGFSIRDVYHGKHWAHLEKAGKVEAGARILEDHGWIRCQTISGTGGRSTTKIRIHPSLRKKD